MSHLAEELERAALQGIHRAATQQLRDRLGIEEHITGPAYISIASALPPSAVLINRTLGSGCDVGATAPAYRLWANYAPRKT